MNQNDFFHLDDYNNHFFEGHQLSFGWWSRHYEYHWAIRYAQAGQIVADAGCGYTFRPFKNVLANHCAEVIAIDSNPKLMNLAPFPDNIAPLIASLEDVPLADGFFDRIFCISVIEECNAYENIINEFARLIKPDGRIVLTFDVIHDAGAPEHPRWKGLSLTDFLYTIDNAGLDFDGEYYADKNNALVNLEFNLCVYHCILKKR